MAKKKEKKISINEVTLYVAMAYDVNKPETVQNSLKKLLDKLQVVVPECECKFMFASIKGIGDAN